MWRHERTCCSQGLMSINSTMPRRSDKKSEILSDSRASRVKLCMTTPTHKLSPLTTEQNHAIQCACLGHSFQLDLGRGCSVTFHSSCRARAGEPCTNIGLTHEKQRTPANVNSWREGHSDGFILLHPLLHTFAGPPVALHVSRYTCRSRVFRILGFCRCSSSISLHPPKRPCRTCRP